ncbi:MAG: DegT/DnrJ/EryC1/StrS family aminotransferase [Halobacteria archaeon]
MTRPGHKREARRGRFGSRASRVLREKRRVDLAARKRSRARAPAPRPAPRPPARLSVPLSRVVIDDEVRRAALRALDSGRYILADECRAFEAELARLTGTKHAVLVNSGTSAIYLALKALGVKEGSEVIVPSLTAFPTVEPICHLGARPVFVDIGDTCTADPDAVRKAVTPRTAAILPVHLYGHPADLGPLLEVASDHSIPLVEDACQAHGARTRGRRVGSMGAAGCFSFYPSKNLTVAGDGGAVTTDRDDIAKAIRMLRDHGRQSKYLHEAVGYNFRFNEIQAAVGRVLLRRLEGFNRRRREVAAAYRKGLAATPLGLPPETIETEPVYHLFVVRTPRREQLQEFLKERGIETGVHYPVPCHLQPALAHLPRTSLPRTEAAAREILSLPIFPSITAAQREHVVRSVVEFFA